MPAHCAMPAHAKELQMVEINPEHSTTISPIAYASAQDIKFHIPPHHIFLSYPLFVALKLAAARDTQRLPASASRWK